MIPLAVRLVSRRVDRHITREIDDLTFRSVIPGGFASAQIRLRRPLRYEADEIEQFARLIIYDGGSAEVAWEGRLDDPGRGAGPNGEIWNLSALGPAAHPKDIDAPLVYIDRNLSDRFFRNPNSSKPGEDAVNVDGADNPALAFGAPRDVVAVGNSWEVGDDYNPIRDAGQKLAAFDYYHAEAIADADWRVQAVTKPSLTLARDEPFTVGATAGSARFIAADFTAGDNLLLLRIRRVDTNITVADDDTGSVIGSIRVVATRYDKEGNELLTAAPYSTSGVLSSEVVEDLLGRRLSEFDGAGSFVQPTSYVIDQLAYPDGVTADKVLADLIEIEGAYFWAAWERPALDLTDTGYRFEFKPWPSTVRYEIPVTAQFDSPGSASELWNAVTVRWVDGNGRRRSTRRTNPVAVLSDAGLSRETHLDLGDEINSVSNAETVGDQFLLEHAVAPNAGTVTVSAPIRDVSNGQIVPPHLIRPGYLCRLLNVAPRPDSLNVGVPDGTTIFRLQAVDYSAARGTATLTLDSPPRSLVGALALTRRRLARARRR